MLSCVLLSSQVIKMLEVHLLPCEHLLNQNLKECCEFNTENNIDLLFLYLYSKSSRASAMKVRSSYINVKIHTSKAAKLEILKLCSSNNIDVSSLTKSCELHNFAFTFAMQVPLRGVLYIQLVLTRKHSEHYIMCVNEFFLTANINCVEFYSHGLM